MKFSHFKATLLGMAVFGCASAGAQSTTDDQISACPGMTEWRAANAAKASASNISETKWSKPRLRRELLNLVEVDQAARARITQEAQTPENFAALKNVDAESLPRIKAILKRYGFPRIAEVGRDGSNAAFLLVQHADTDPAFQTRALEMVRPLLARQEIAGPDVALLTDRVLIARGELQRYGSQFHSVDGVNTVRPTEDSLRVDERRASMGLYPMHTYACMMTAVYGAPADISPLGLKP